MAYYSAMQTDAGAAGAGRAKAQPRLLFWLTFAIIALLFSLSAMALTHLGLHYEVAGGSVIEKLHPAHLLLLLTLALLVLSSRRPAQFFDEVFRRHKGAMLFLLTWLLLLFQIIVAQHMPFTPVIDTFFMPVGLLLLLSHIGAGDRVRLAWLLHAFMLANAFLGLAEFALGFRLTPIFAGDMILVDEWRSSALLGHPLANAVMTGSYLVILSLGGWRDLPWGLRPMAFGVNLLAMNAFGGRMALVAMLAFLVVIFGLKFLRLLHGARESRRNLVLAALLVPLGLAALFAGLEMGLFDQFLLRFVDDKGSASARVILMDIFRDLPLSAILFGPDPQHLSSLLRNYGLNFGIESFWIAFILSYGLFASLIFFVGLFLFLHDLVRSSSPIAFWPLLYFFLVSSTSVSLSAKSTDLALMVVLVMVLSPPEAARRKAASPKAPPSSSRQADEPPPPAGASFV